MYYGKHLGDPYGQFSLEEKASGLSVQPLSGPLLVAFR